MSDYKCPPFVNNLINHIVRTRQVWQVALAKPPSIEVWLSREAFLHFIQCVEHIPGGMSFPALHDELCDWHLVGAEVFEANEKVPVRGDFEIRLRLDL